MISLVIHGLAVGVILFLSFWRVEELWSPSVKVTVFPRAKAPPAAVRTVVGSGAGETPPEP